MTTSTARSLRYRIDIAGKTWATLQDIEKCQECWKAQANSKPAFCTICWVDAFKQQHPDRAKELAEAIEVLPCNICKELVGKGAIQEPDGKVWCQRCWGDKMLAVEDKIQFDPDEFEDDDFGGDRLERSGGD